MSTDAPDTGARTSPEARAMATPSLSTYRALRLAMVGAVGLLAVSIGLERGVVDCWQTSISGYWFTPVRAVFVGSLVAIGVCLIAIRGRSDVEDAWLSVAGMLAPVVALAPTTDVATCWSVAPEVVPDGAGFPPAMAVAVRNNVTALVVTGVVAVLVAVLIGRATSGSMAGAARSMPRGTRWALVAAVVLVGLGAVALTAWDAVAVHAHAVAAVGMFLALGAAVWANGGAAARGGESAWSRAYRAIALAMVAPALLLLPWFGGFDHRTFVVEALEIGLFALFWILQTRQWWDVRTPAVSTSRRPQGDGGATRYS